jgi:hypothetical protein
VVAEVEAVLVGEGPAAPAGPTHTTALCTTKCACCCSSLYGCKVAPRH